MTYEPAEASWWQRLGRGNVLGWQSIAALAVFSAFLVVVANPRRLGGDLAVPLLVSLAALPLLLLILLLARVTIMRPDRGTPRPAVVLAVYITACLVRSIVNAWLLVRLGVIDSTGLAQRVALAVPSFVGLLVVIDLTTGAVAQHRRTMNALLARQRHAAAVRDEALARVASRRDQALTLVRDEIDAVSRSIDTDSPTAVVARMRRSIEDVVRPLSHDMRTSMPQPEALAPAAASNQRWRSLLDDATRGEPLRPGVIALCMFVIGVIYVFVALPFLQALLEMSIATFGVWLVVSAGSLATRDLRARSGAGARAVIVTAVLVVSGLLLAGISIIILGRSDVTERLAFAYIFFVPVVGWGLALSRASERQLERMERDQRSIADALDWQAARARAESWLEDQDVSQLLHGPVQGALGVAAIRLSMAIDDDGEASPEAIDSARDHLREVLTDLDRDERADTGDVHAALDAAAQTWRGIAEITATLEPAAEDALAHDTVCNRLVSTIITEACWNSIRHGQATSIAISVTLPGPGADAIEVTVVDNGAGPDDVAAAGYGTQMLAYVTLSWTRRHSATGTELRALLPCASSTQRTS